MSRTQCRFTAQIAGQTDRVFDLIADMPNYADWLPGSNAFGGTTEVTPYPVQLGTSYLDWGPAGSRRGSVTAFDRPRSIAFHQTMLLKRGPLTADVNITIDYTLKPSSGGTAVVRDLDITVQMPGLMRLATPMVVAAFRKENARTLAALRRYFEKTSTA